MTGGTVPVLRDILIADRPIGPDHPPFIIAEISANHGGSLDRALATITAAKDAGAHAVKLQTYRADTITIEASGPGFDITEGPWAGQTLFQLYEAAHTPWEWHGPLFEHARSLDIPVFSSPFDLTAVDLLKGLDAPAYKIASFEIVDHALIAACAATGRPMVMSTGMASLEEIHEAVAVARSHGCQDLIVLHCVSGYPTPADQANLQRIPWLRRHLPGVQIGLSDHTLGTAVPVASIALGATAIEKHFILQRSDGGPDAFFSLEPKEMAAVVRDTRDVWAASRTLDLDRQEAERGNVGFRRSLYIVADVKAGDILTPDNVRSIRPGHGLKPKYLETVLGRRATVDIRRGTPLAWELISA